MLQSLGILYAEHALLERKSMTNFQRFCRQKSRRSPTMYSNRLLGVVRSTGALFRASSWHLQTVQLHRELN